MNGSRGQLDLFGDPDVDLRDYDVIVVNSSAGKDSQVALDVTAGRAAAAGVTDRVTVLHCDLGRTESGEPLEWPGTAALAREQAAHYGLRFETRRRPQGTLLDQVRHRGMWPSAKARYCTSDHKRAQGRKLITQLVGELGLDRQAKVLNVFGYRAEESCSRARRRPLDRDPGASSGVRDVWTWSPILDWTLDQVWTRIRATGVRYHPAYDLGMSRLSCSLCILGSRSDHLTAIRHRPALARDYLEVEDEIGHRFTHAASMRELIRIAATDARHLPQPQLLAEKGAGR